MYRPLVVLTLAFAAGIAAAVFALPLVLACLLCFLLLLALCAFTRRPLWSGGAIVMAFALLGSAHYYADVDNVQEDVSRFAPAFVTLTGKIESDVEATAGRRDARFLTARFTLAARRIIPASAQEPSGNAIPVSGNVEVRLSLLAQIQATSVVEKKAWQGIPNYGDTVRVRGLLEAPSGPRNPGAFDTRAFLAGKGIYATLTARRPEDWQIVRPQREPDNPLLRLAFALRQGVLCHARDALSPKSAGALNGILLGERGDLPGALNADFERTGTTHILATAGLHVGMVVGLLLGFLRLFGVGRRPALFLTLGTLMLYAIMAGGRPSVVRAALMAGVYLSAFLLEREPDLPNALALAALILLLLNPRSLFDIGFQLSFATVSTILALMPLAEGALQRIRARIKGDRLGARLARRAAESVAACCFLAIAAQIGAMPLVAYYFNEVSLVSILTNTLVVPLIALLIALGFCAALLGALAPWLAWPLDRVLEGLLAYLIWVIQWTSALPFASLSVASPPVPLLIGYYAVIGGAVWRWRARTPLRQTNSQAP